MLRLLPLYKSVDETWTKVIKTSTMQSIQNIVDYYRYKKYNTLNPVLITTSSESYNNGPSKIIFLCLLGGFTSYSWYFIFKKLYYHK
jgi:hypothetical protein